MKDEIHHFFNKKISEADKYRVEAKQNPKQAKNYLEKAQSLQKEAGKAMEVRVKENKKWLNRLEKSL